MTLIRTADEIDGAWLAGALGQAEVEVRDVTRIGTGQMSLSYRVRYDAKGSDGGDPLSVVVKLAAADETSRNTGVGLGAYLREITFYRELRDRIGGPLPECRMAAYDDAEGWFTLILEDIVGAEQGDQIAGCDPDTARIALKTLARIHAPVFGDLALGATAWLNQPFPLNTVFLTALLPGFLERYGERISPEHQELCERFVPLCDAWLADERPPLGLVHGDYRLDNLLFADGGCTAVDWQTVGWGPVMRDAAYFMAGGLTPEDRRASEEELIRGYHSELKELGVSNFSWDQCWEEYRRQPFLGIVMTVAAAMVTEQTERGDDMFMTWLERNAQMVIDLGSMDLLPEPGSAATQALRPKPIDEGTHAPGPEPVWNESWYFDAISADGKLGVYHRIGRVPNQGACLVSTCIVRPGEPTLMLVDAGAPLPPDDDPEQRIDVDGLAASQRCEEELERFSVSVTGIARAFADHSAPLRAEEGEPVEIALEATWETEGIPYAWRLATRYEIPCRVHGTVTIAGETFELEGPGQRDHSWGARDWWASDWMWSACHLDDGTRTHAVTVPTHPDFGVGYSQRGGELLELAKITSSEEVGENGLITEARITMEEAGVDLLVESLAFGALRLESPEGRISHFPRAMCSVRATDGRAGFAWVEWNRNQS